MGELGKRIALGLSEFTVTELNGHKSLPEMDDCPLVAQWFSKAQSWVKTKQKRQFHYGTHCSLDGYFRFLSGLGRLDYVVEVYWRLGVGRIGSAHTSPGAQVALKIILKA
jgi:hypothetical protein